MAHYKVRSNQNIIDVCLIIYGNLDKLSQLLSDNGLTPSSFIYEGQELYYPDGTKVKTKEFGTNNEAFPRPGVGPTILSQPVELLMCSGNVGYFTVGVIGNPMSFQWEMSSDYGYTYYPLTPDPMFNGINSFQLEITEYANQTAFPYNYFRLRIDGFDGFTPVTVYSDPARLIISDAITVSGIDYTGSDGSLYEWGDSYFVYNVDTGHPIAFEWEWSTDGITYNTIDDTTFNPGGPTIGCTVVKEDNYLFVYNIYREMNGWWFRGKAIIPCGYAYTDPIQFNFNTYPPEVENYHDAVYLNGTPWTEREKSSLIRLVDDLYGKPNSEYDTYDIIGYFKGLYPMMGSDNFSHSLNLVDAMSATPLTFHGHPNDTYTGTRFDGYTWADTGINTNLFSDEDKHLSYYSRSINPVSVTLIGGSNTTGSIDYIQMIPSGNQYNGYLTSTSPQIVTLSDLKGLSVVSRTGSGQLLLNVNSNIHTTTIPVVSPTSGGTYWIGGRTGDLALNECSFASVGNSLKKEWTISLCNAVNKFQENLGRLPYVAGIPVVYLTTLDTSSYSGTGSVWYDISSYGNNSNLVGSPTYTAGSTWTPGTPSYLTFNGSGQYGKIPYSLYLDLSANNYTIDLWFSINDFTNPSTLIAKTDSTLYDWSLRVESEWKITFNGSSGVIMEYDLSTALVAGQWYHLALSGDITYSGRLYVYLNGDLTAYGNPYVSNNPSVNVSIASEQASTPIDPMNGKLGIIRFYTRTLTDTEILQNYNLDKYTFGY